MQKQGTLIIFAKAPRRGTVKTRLAAGIGTEKAARVYRALTEQTLRAATGFSRFKVVLFVSPDRFQKKGRYWPSHIPRYRQGQGNLGQRMARALEHFTPGPVILIGSDIPDVSQDILQDAFALLSSHDYVFGPAEDGGFWLVGCRRKNACRALFKNVPWSQSTTLGRTLKNIPPTKRVARTATLNDLDTIEDLHALLNTPQGMARFSWAV